MSDQTRLVQALKTIVPSWATGLGGRGIMHHHLRALMTSSQTADNLNIAHALAQWRWQLLPWDKQTTVMYADLARASGRYPPPKWALSTFPQSNGHFALAVQQILDGNTVGVKDAWLKYGMKSPSLEWLGETCLFFLKQGDRALAAMALETAAIPIDHPVRALFSALLAYHYKEPNEALRDISALPEEFRWLRHLLEGEYRIRMGDSTGKNILIKLQREIPWHTNLTLKLHDLLSPTLAPAQPSADTAVLIYTWNNAALLESTLISLSHSDLGAASVLILDNGSSDHTPEVIQACAGLFGQRMKTFRLPVNIGAPSARNWLLKHPEASRFKTLVFVDDDVLLPSDWLTRLTAQYRQAPAGTIVGCRIMDQEPKKTVQMADVNLLDIESDGDFLIANAGSGELDLGLHDYSRPCLSVTGCCHMMDRRHAEELGGFDLRFGPSQFDDFDLDLRNALQGGHAIFAGRTAIRHCQRSSLNQADSEAKQGHIQGNMIKLNSKYSPEQKRELLRINRELLWEDLLIKTRDLENA